MTNALGNTLVRAVKRRDWNLNRYVMKDARQCLECGGEWWAGDRQEHREGCTVVEMREGVR